IFTSAGRPYDSGLILAEKLGSFGMRCKVASESWLDGYDLGRLAGKSLAEMQALDPDATERVMAYKLGFPGELHLGTSSSRRHYWQVLAGVENGLRQSVDT